ncbi:aldose 1-epimerase [Paraburkholderia caffeinilytica]|uniref:Aldose 1-epimerase n=2 Tax=Paraburkholderia caffeinilytica TaxID=1761016 RepID=A0ABQ1NCQ3_9BURK|nr:aldose 1-epimerase [Paraburkholderia caffeinilytica]CAB3809124.1 Aldose 1-epimerase [Paraburkholderia caffeinilytica]
MLSNKMNRVERVKVASWGTLPDGRNVRTFTLTNTNGVNIRISDLGAALVSWIAPDRDGIPGEILLGHDTPGEYLVSGAYMGALVGRWANRIEAARFNLDGVEYPLIPNEGLNLLHGGLNGFHQIVWKSEQDGDALIMRLDSPDGDGGFPGNLQVQVRYTLSDDNALAIEYMARTDRATPVNLTSHPYFNLAARAGSDIRAHRMKIQSDAYFEVDAALIPRQCASVDGGPFDFRHEASIGSRLDVRHPQLDLAQGFDHCYVLRDGADMPKNTLNPALLESSRVRPVATVVDPESGRMLTVSTDQAGLQFYSGNRLGGTLGRGGVPYRTHAGLCLEAGGFPNQINMPDRRAVIATSEIPYRQVTVYQTGVLARQAEQ